MHGDTHSPTEKDTNITIAEKALENKQSRTLSGLEPYRGPWGSNEIIHLLKRTMFGAKKKDVDHFRKKDLAQVVDELLSPAAFNFPPPLNDYDSIGLNVPYGKTWVGTPNIDVENVLRIESFQKWTMGAFINQDTSVREKMVLFWHNHFATEVIGRRCDMIWNHHSLLRAGALGNFKELTRSITTDSHMLQYLNGEANTSLAPNENYARELQELFCIGKGPESKYTEDDVKQAAKVLTGWKVDLEKGTTYFKAEEHDTSDKLFSSFYGNAVIKGRGGPDSGKAELDELLNMIFSNKETALFFCRKLYRWFVYYKIDESVETNLIEPLAAIMRKNNYEVKPVLAALFKSTHFFDAANQGVQIKSPIDYCIGMQREFNVTYAAENLFAFNYSMWALLFDNAAKMGQKYSAPPNVSGWPAYYQLPGFYDQWINTTTFTRRNEFSITMIDYGFNMIGRFFIVDTVAFAESFSDPSNPALLINESLELLYRMPVSEASRKELKKNTLLSGQMQDHYWTDAWKEYKANPANTELRAVVESRLKYLYRYIVNSAEYQLI